MRHFGLIMRIGIGTTLSRTEVMYFPPAHGAFLIGFTPRFVPQAVIATLKAMWCGIKRSALFTRAGGLVPSAQASRIMDLPRPGLEMNSGLNIRNADMDPLSALYAFCAMKELKYLGSIVDSLLTSDAVVYKRIKAAT
jgi:hypothetical protein